MVKPVWNNTQRVNHQNFAKKTHPYAKKNLVLRAILMKSGLVSINTARQNISKTAVSVNTARQVNTAHSKTIVNAARPMSYLSKIAHSTVKRPIHKNTTFKNSNIDQRVNTVSGKKINTARPKAVVNAVKGNNVNAVKASTCWVWKPKTKVLDNGNPQMDLQDQGAKTINEEQQLHALVDGKKVIITESTVRRYLQLEDEEGVDCLPNATIFEQLALMSPKTTAWNEFSSTMASANICLATNQKFNFSKFIFESMIRNLENVFGKFLMYPRRVGKGFSGRVTPLFPTMVVQNQAELGEGSAIPTDPHHTPTIIESSTQPQKTQKPRKPKKKDTQVPQTSGPTEHVVDEAVHKELGDSLVRAATTASSLEAEHDSGNITKTRSKATPNESSSLGTTSGGGPRRQETMGDTIAQTRFENVSKLSNDSLLARGNTLRSYEDRLKLNELMEICTNLQQRVLDLEKTMTTQQNEIASLKRRVKKLEKKKRSRTHGMKRLYKVGLTARVESSGDEEDLGEDASKQERRTNAIDADEDITLVSVQDDANKEMFYVDTLNGEEVFVAGQNENIIEEIVKGIVLQEPGESTTTKISSQGLSQDKGKGILVEPDKPLKKKDQLKLDEEITLKIQAEIDEEERIARAEEEKIDEANIA
ncbi:hypothetical protein Tco_0678147 [Tanacetum coccineum]|uniref:Uncharacterized protein n=1 Tax=Tanacetum coccineum TaxID=301880 RepID=A0ABQ4XEA5_9ASTR